MNTLLSNAQLFELDPALVDTGNRIGFLHQDKAAALGRLMKVDGQRDPIKVVAQPKNAAQPWRLVTGMHRTVGAALEGITVWAIEVSGKPEALADLEASENLHRRPLGPIERAKFTAALVQAAQDRIARENGNLKQQQMAIKARWDRVKAAQLRPDEALTEEVNDTCATMAHVYGWEESVGEALGMSRRSIHRDLELYRLIIAPFPAQVEALIREAQVWVTTQLANVSLAPEKYDLPRKYTDVHLTYKGTGMMGARLALAAGNILNGQSNDLGPSILSFVGGSTTHVITFSGTTQPDRPNASTNPGEPPVGFQLRSPGDPVTATYYTVPSWGYAWSTNGSGNPVLTLTTTQDATGCVLAYPGTSLQEVRGRRIVRGLFAPFLPLRAWGG